MKKWLLLLFLTALSAAAQSVALDPVSATHGAKFKKEGTSLVIDFPAYDRKINNTHPTVNLLMPPDCTAYDGVDVDMRLSGGLSTSLSINFRDSSGKQCYDVRPVADGIRTTLRFRFNPAKKMDKKAMKYLRIYLGRPALAAQFTIYGIKFFSILEEKKQILLPVAKEFGVAKEVEKLTNLTDCEKVTAQLRKKQIAKLISESTPDGRRFPFGGAFCSPLARPLPFCGVISDELSLSGELSLALNETENLNLLTVSTKSLKSVTASVSGLPSHLSSSVHPVGAVLTKQSNAPGAYIGWHFDPVLSYTSRVAPLRSEQLQLWVLRVNSKKGIPGTYKGKVTFTYDGGTFSLPFQVKVHPFALPLRKSLKTATSVYSSKLLGSNKKAFEKWLLDNFYLNNFSIYSESGAYGDPQLPPVSDYIDAVKRGANFIPILYLKLPRQAHHTHKKISPGQSKILWEKMSAAEQAHYPAGWKNKYIAILRKRIPELKKANLWQYAACYAFDEATPSEWPAIVELVKELKKEFPDLKIVSTLTDNTYGLQSILANHIDGWIPPVRQYSFERAAKARALGRQVWYYTASLTVDSFPLASIRTQLGERACASQVDGWLIWTVTRWYNNPKPITTDDPLTCWEPESYPGDNGGGSYFCMGQNNTFLSTLRSEAMRDGIEDYEYYTLMTKLAAKRKASDPLRLEAEKLKKSLSRSGNITPEQLLKNRAAAAALIERMMSAKSE